MAALRAPIPLLFCCLATWTVSAASATDRSGSGPVGIERRVLALFDGEREAKADETRIHKYAEMVLNHLGYIVHYWDVRDPLPDIDQVEQFAGVITWFSQPPAQRARYLGWAAETLVSAKRLIILGSTGGEFWTEDFAAILRLLRTIGLKHHRRAVEQTIGAVQTSRGRQFTAFEHENDPVLPTFEIITRSGSEGKEWLTIQVPSSQGGGHGIAVFVGPHGGYVQSGYDLVEEPGLGRAAWLINPFSFFRDALGSELWPVPDVTTLSGRRVYFSHVESDGLNNVITRPKRGLALVPESFLAEIVDKFPELPVTLALTPGDLDPSIGGNQTPQGILRTIWARPHVEPSLSSYTRPYRWTFFERYNRQAEVALLEKRKGEVTSGLQTILGYLQIKASSDHTVSLGQDLPRNYLHFPFDLKQEMEHALAVSERLVPFGKRIRLYQWTGDAAPFERAIAATRAMELLNINGGESRFDNNYPSITAISPLARPVGAERQIYAVGADEFSIAKSWRPATTAFTTLQQTLLNTEWPRRLQAFNLHYHLATIGDARAAKAITTLLEQARAADVVPITTAEYARMADDFFSVEVSRTSKLRWEIFHRGQVQTVRFDHAEDLSVDLTRSHGVLGQRRHANSLYVALDGAHERAIVALRNRQTVHQEGLSLMSSRWRIWHFSQASNEWSFESSGFGHGEFSWEGAVPGRALVQARRNGEVLWNDEIGVKADGLLQFRAPIDGITPLTVTITHLSPRGVQ